MQNIVIIANGAAYGSESLFNSLRLAIAARAGKPSRFTPVFDVRCRNRRVTRSKPAEGYNIQQMLEILTAQNVPVKLCKTCADGRGITPAAD
ncbi:DsrE family protein [Salmonella enterica subsp. enterica serovar Senftenberg]|nr:DsrE family protein [Salmonella enterica subsp. enterica serovar Senftenberg]